MQINNIPTTIGGDFEVIGSLRNQMLQIVHNLNKLKIDMLEAARFDYERLIKQLTEEK